jgi:signal transduction histidine kinase
MIRLSPGQFLRYVGLPCTVFVILFFGGSELLEHHFYYTLSEPTLHILHTVRGIFSVFFVAILVYYSLSHLQESSARKMETLCSLLNAAKQGLIAFDSSWKVLSLNALASEMLGSIHTDHFRQWAERLRERLQNEQELELDSPAGETLLRVLALQSHEGGYLLLLQDVTTEHKKEEQWLITEKMATIGRMAAGLAHEIGTPLNIISGRAELIESMQASVCVSCEATTNCAVNKHISVIFQQIERITRIIQQLLAQARGPALEKEVFCLNSSVQKVIAFLQPELEKKHIHLKFNLQKNLPSIYGSSDQYQQILINLMTNAMDAVEGKEGRIEIRTELKGQELELSIKDNGVGIPETNLTKIFDPFFTTKEFGRGTGLGLTVTSNIVRSSGGRIDVSSKVDQGTEVLVHIPASSLQIETSAQTA